MRFCARLAARPGSGWLENPQEVPAKTLSGLYPDSEGQSIPESPLDNDFTTL